MIAKGTDQGIKTVLDLIVFQYAKVIAKRAFFSENHKRPFDFDENETKKIFSDVGSGSKLWSEMNQADWQFLDRDRQCAYCGTKNDLKQARIVPESIHIKSECRDCDKMQAATNHVWACGLCNEKKGNKGVYEFYGELHPKRKKFYDAIPTTLERKYLKTIYHCHECAGTLDRKDLNGDGELTVMDIDFVLRR